MLPPLPGWITAAPTETHDAAAFRSGAALAHLSLATAADDVPIALWRDRLALAAAEVCVGFAGRREGAGAIRDALHLTRAGDDPGPAGEVLRQWSRAVARPISVAHLGRALEGVAPERIALCLDAAGPAPVDRAVQVIKAVLADSPRGEIADLILADAVPARSLGWTHVLPLLSLALKPRDLRLRGDDLRMACQQLGAATRPAYAPANRDAARLIPLSPRKPSLPPSGWRLCATCPIPSNSHMPAWQTRRRPTTFKERVELRQEIGGLHIKLGHCPQQVGQISRSGEEARRCPAVPAS
jgi:hypothetical protein